jgi:hypothetical protein
MHFQSGYEFRRHGFGGDGGQGFCGIGFGRMLRRISSSPLTASSSA